MARLFVCSRASPSMQMRSSIPDYSQLSPEYWIVTPSYMTRNTSSVQKLKGINSTDSNLRYRLWYGLEPYAPLWYIQDMTHLSRSDTQYLLMLQRHIAHATSPPAARVLTSNGSD
ncbi:hypothetical protein BO82DRAFT_94414 [Aspergillus uvarum CBS 121591]|uniref:Uncharacterized protein n=1 Tax=Aspergillus uvarum CBS 121591 TaxID=1448315 RepID=A0A319C6U2_9EURO|nr:hypothetical protein BO82DRAFT_94414 [Aspergillus uvarum CBS 121591]PYH81065.1 hypothetical protein BO82DRAFT_94414 [Aspergillus uvarum CBS 121591]